MPRICELHSEEDFRKAYPVMRELRTHLSEARYFELLASMRPDGYRLFALHENDEIVALAGIAIRTSFYNGRYVFVYDLVTQSDARSRGHGCELLRYIEELARGEGCDMVSLTSGFQRVDAHRFYEERMRYAKPGAVFTKNLR